MGKRKKRLSFKERKEQTLLETLDDIHGTAEALSSQSNSNKKSSNKPKPKKQKPKPKQTKDTSNSSESQWAHMKDSGKSNNRTRHSTPTGNKSTSNKKSTSGNNNDAGRVRPPKLRKKDSTAKTVVYIDGENTFFQFYDQLRKTRKVKYREDLTKYDLRWLIEKALGEKLGKAEVRYYGVRLKEVDSTPEMLERTKRMIDHKNRWSGFLSSQDVNYIAAGELKIRATENYNGSNKPNLTFEEKGVDVQMAVEMVDDAASGKVEHALLLSSDRDLQPAIQVAQKHGVKVSYITHDKRANDSIVGVVDQTCTFTSRDITEAFKRVN